MAIWHGEKGRKATGGLIHLSKKKRKHQLGSFPVHTKIGKEKREISLTKGARIKIKAVSVEFANVYDPSSKKTRKLKILDIVRNEANLHFVRRGIITKGAIIKTEVGDARVTSRPSQHGIVNAIALANEEKK